MAEIDPPNEIDRRGFLRSVAMAGAAVPMAAGAQIALAQTAAVEPGTGPDHSGHPQTGNDVVGEVDNAKNGFDPHAMLTDWDAGSVSTGADGRRVREWTITAIDQEFEVAPGVMFAGWSYNGRIPGPTLRCTEGETLRIRFVNAGTHPHSMHFHGIHAARMDGVPGAGLVKPGEEFTYEFEAKPFGCHLYHCHAIPLKRHIHKGLYGGFIVDPDPARHPEAREKAASRLLGAPENAPWQELVMVMNGFDTNFDDENEFYAVNSIPFAYFRKPIRIEKSRPVRIYLINITEFDPINSFHLHAHFFDFYDHGTTLTPTHRTIDTVMMCQAQRGILEFSFADHEPGLYMFHAHQSEFAELGWMSHFEVVG
ncbi:MAG: multicopper oxidase domain-containing protein [Aestuariivirga sp.]